MKIRLNMLTVDDALLFHRLRLRSLREHPEAFGSAYEDELNSPQEKVMERFQGLPDRFIYGAWAAEQLVGFAGFWRYPGLKTRHRGGIGGMYVAPEVRGQGIGSALLAQLIEEARLLPGLEEITLAVTVGNMSARSIYLAAGFKPSHIEKRYIKFNERYYDIEWMTLFL
ncbi:MAG: GNAT family N-acetyltransferase [Caldilineaceae bacterium]